MNEPKKEIIFLNRAYNDLDIQLSLIAAFADDERFSVRVIGYPCDGNLGTPQSHEAVPYMQDRYNVAFETVLDAKECPLYLRLMHKTERWLHKMRKAKWARAPLVQLPLKAVHVSILGVIRKILRRPLPWLDKAAQNWNPFLVICDEALAQQGRSYTLDHVLRNKAEKGTPVYIIKTGHQIYWDPAPNKDAAIDSIIYQKTPAARYFVPCEMDKMAAETYFTNENIEIHGNIRMDVSWIGKLHKEILAPPYLDKAGYLDNLPEGTPKIVFMLSKLGYGIEIQQLKDTIKAIANIPGIACAIKPHTRGMKFDFMSQSEIGNIAIVDDIPSTLLIEWSDLVLFTGSSIAFHSLLLDKRVGFLQYCQYLKTIFDDGIACEKFDSLEQLVSFVENWRDNGLEELTAKQKAELAQWKTKHIHGGVADGQTANHYKKLILGDMGLKENKKAA